MGELFVSLTRGFGRKLLILLLVDVAIGTIRSLWEIGGVTAAIGFVVIQLPYSLILAAIWNAVDRKGI
jgi:hypothetical protein